MNQSETVIILKRHCPVGSEKYEHLVGYILAIQNNLAFSRTLAEIFTDVY